MTLSATGLRQAALATLMPGFTGGILPDWLAALLREGLGALCLFSTNITSPGGLRRLTDEARRANPGVVIAVDEEGGDVTRLWHHAGGSQQPGNAVLGRLDDDAVTAHAAGTLAAELQAAGVTMTLGPVADINSDPRNPVIGTRSFGAEPDLVARHVRTWVRELQAGHVAACAKHFPGHGDTATDSHLALPVVDRSPAQLTARELVPFVGAVAAGTQAVMIAHLLLPQLDPAAPATTSAPVIQGLLRDRLGFDGVVVTDALDMAGAGGVRGMAASAVASLRAGADLLCLGTGTTPQQVAQIVDAVGAAVARGQLGEDRLLEAGSRARRLAGRYPAPASSLRPPARSAAVVPAERIAASFDVSARARALLAEHRRVVLLRLETAANIAVGPGEWGPFGLLGGPGSPRLVGVEDVLDRLDGDDTLGVDDLLVVVGRDNHRHVTSREVIGALRESHRATLVVDMGWADPAAGVADIATYGGSPAVGRALLDLLEDVR
ncbi:glycoside hydrolase family 3 protein [Georgenia sp. MJ170]|uniref:glycoside hydrolase family 3 protein n=1 Tax=Georgenia sunbinii TaxID=3117728 RepID=UPI002F26AA90